MRGGGFLGLAALAVVGIIIADVLIHPRGTRAAFGGINTGVGTTSRALLGKG